MMMAKETLMLLVLIFAVNVLCKTADDELKGGYLDESEIDKDFAKKDESRQEDDKTLPKAVHPLSVKSDERSLYDTDSQPERDETESKPMEYILVDPDEPTPDKILTSTKQGVSYTEMAAFPLFSWHRKIWMQREIPYVILHQGKTRGLILEAMRRLKGNVGTCLSFRPKRSSDKWWMEFFYGTGCFSDIGTKYWKTGATRISIGLNCDYNDIIQHEILHALGFLHEQSRIDRDQYVKIFWDNIENGMSDNFKRSDVKATYYYNTPYDYKSLMHYGKNDFSKRGFGDTIHKLGEPNFKLGGRVMSPIDIKELKAMYHCQQTHNGWSSWMPAQCMCSFDKAFCSQSKVRICIGKSRCPGSRQEYNTQHISRTCKPSEACEDNKKYEKQCRVWATEDQCRKNPTWMKKNCCISCSSIGKSHSDCKDNSKYAKICVTWAKIGECKKNPGWMLKNCCKSCKGAS